MKLAAKVGVGCLSVFLVGTSEFCAARSGLNNTVARCWDDYNRECSISAVGGAVSIGGAIGSLGGLGGNAGFSKCIKDLGGGDANDLIVGIGSCVQVNEGGLPGSNGKIPDIGIDFNCLGSNVGMSAVCKAMQCAATIAGPAMPFSLGVQAACAGGGLAASVIECYGKYKTCESMMIGELPIDPDQCPVTVTVAATAPSACRNQDHIDIRDPHRIHGECSAAVNNNNNIPTELRASCIAKCFAKTLANSKATMGQYYGGRAPGILPAAAPRCSNGGAMETWTAPASIPEPQKVYCPSMQNRPVSYCLKTNSGASPRPTWDSDGVCRCSGAGPTYESILN